MRDENPEIRRQPISDRGILAKVREGEIAIPEIQRPFVWDASQVRDLLDSLYQGSPVGYLIAWRNPDVKLKDGSTVDKILAAKPKKPLPSALPPSALAIGTG